MMFAPRLSRSAELIPGSVGLLARGTRQVELIELELPAAQQAQLLEMFDGCHELAEICAATGLDAQRVGTLIDRLTALGLVATDAPCVALVEPSTYFRDVGSVAGACERPHNVLLVGLGHLGLALLRDLLRFEHFRLRLFDPTVVDPLDVSPFYRAEELGRSKSELVDKWLGTAQRARVQVIVPGCFSAAGVERDLVAALAAVDVVVCCLDQPNEISNWLARACHAQHIALVVAQLTAHGGLIDPVLAGERSRYSQGCPSCAALYRAGADPFAAALVPYLVARFPRSASWRYRHEAGQIRALAELVALALRKALDVRAGQQPADSTITKVDFDDWRVDSPPVPKHFACRLCYPVSAPDPTAMSARLRHAAGPIDLAVLAERLRPLAGATYAIFEPELRMAPHDRPAIFRSFRSRGVDPLLNRLANAHRATSIRRLIVGADTLTHVGEYLDLDAPGKAEAIAIIEGLERLFSLDYCAPERIVNGAYSDLAASALDPRRLPLYAEEQYLDPGFPLRRFEPQASMPWIEGVTLTTDRPILVPLDFVRSTSGPALYHATSNGAACHSSLPHAIVNAIYETVERDAFMITWLNRLSLPGIEITATDPDPYGLRDTFHRLGFELALVDLTTDLEIPVLLGVLRDRQSPDFLLTNMVASLDPGRALCKLCRELAQFAYSYLRDPQCFETELTHAVDPARVSTFRDHLAFYQSREKHRHVDFLTQAPPARRLGEGPYLTEIPDIHAELNTLDERLSRRGYQIIVVDCTVPLLAQLGLSVVKVVIPGLQPLHAGFGRRVLGGRRLYRAPVDMGLSIGEKSIRELNPWPHPFW